MVLSRTPASLLGLGATMEGFGVNAFMFDFFFDKAWNTGISDSEVGEESCCLQSGLFQARRLNPLGKCW
jgi:hypothetical protein